MNSRPQVRILYPPPMRRYKDEDILKAKSMRKEKGYSFIELQRLTGIPATTIRNWCRGETVYTRQTTLLNSNERKRKLIKTSENSIFKTIDAKISIPQAKIYTALLYWCEGSKYPATNKVYFTNSDPELVKLFLFLLRRSFLLDESRIRVHLQLHNIHSQEKMKDFWSKLLLVPKAQFIKPTITHMKRGKHRRSYFGTCTVRYPDFTLLLKLTGIYETFVKHFGEMTELSIVTVY